MFYEVSAHLFVISSLFSIIAWTDTNTDSCFAQHS